MSQSLFLPAVEVDDSGKVTIDWFDSWSNVTLDDGETVSYDYKDGTTHSELLDGILGTITVDPYSMTQISGPTPAERLRRLADYMEAHGA